jgi:hypothetical protein
MARLRLLSAQATGGFMRHVLARPASAAKQDRAQELLAASEQEAAELAAQVGDPDAISDKDGDLPAERRERHLDEHMRFFRHPLLREWFSGQQRRFRPLLAMPAPQAADMCSECQAPADWHTYALSLRLWPGTPAPGSTAAKLAALLPGWRERYPACTDHQIRHQWGGTGALPGFDAAQWQAMLTPVLRAIFRARPDDATQTARPARRAAATASRRRSPGQTTPRSARRTRTQRQRARAMTSACPQRDRTLSTGPKVAVQPGLQAAHRSRSVISLRQPRARHAKPQPCHPLPAAAPLEHRTGRDCHLPGCHRGSHGAPGTDPGPAPAEGHSPGRGHPGGLRLRAAMRSICGWYRHQPDCRTNITRFVRRRLTRSAVTLGPAAESPRTTSPPRTSWRGGPRSMISIECSYRRACRGTSRYARS